MSQGDRARDDEVPSPVVRSHRAKRAGNRSFGRIDGGAIATGFVLPLAAFAPAVVMTIPWWLAAVLSGVGLFLGGFLAATIRTEETMCGATHGAFLAVCFLAMVALVSGATWMASGEPSEIAMIWELTSSPTLALLSGASGLFLGTLGGYIGGSMGS